MRDENLMGTKFIFANQETNNAIEIIHMCKSFGHEKILKDINMNWTVGKIHGIIGRNGSGKTVLLKCICGFLKPEYGEIKVQGKLVGKDCDFAPDTGMLIETPGFLPHETGLRNLTWLARLGKGVSKVRICEIMTLVGLEPTLKKTVNKYSLGMRQRLGIAQALLDDPQLLILDEPMNGLDKAGVQDVRSLLCSIKALGKTVILASHFVQDIDELCDTVCEVDQGVLTQVK